MKLTGSLPHFYYFIIKSIGNQEAYLCFQFSRVQNITIGNDIARHDNCNITMGNDIATDAHCNFTMGNDIATDAHCNITMGNDVARDYFTTFTQEEINHLAPYKRTHLEQTII